MTDKENFEKKLLTELRQVSAENPVPAQARPARPRRYGRFAAVGAGLAAVVAGIAIYTSTGDNTPTAYGVEKQSDGLVSVEITDLNEADGLEDSLRAAGVPAEVSMTPVAATVCASEADPASDLNEPEGGTPPISMEIVPMERSKPARTEGAEEAPVAAVPIQLSRADAAGTSFSINPKDINKGQTVIIAPGEAQPAGQPARADAPGAPPIEVSIAQPAKSDC